LQDHFLLKKSLREVIYRNRGDGSMRKFLMQIDGQNKNGACKYFIFQQTAGLDGMEWEPLPGVDGNLKPYEEAVSSIFGPKELYLRTAFITQRPTKNLPDLTDATAGEKKALFVELAGIDYLQRFADTAGEKAKEEAAHCHDAEIKAQMLEAAITGKDSAEKELQEAETALTVGQFTLEEVLAKGKGAKADVDRLQAAWEAERQRQWEADSVAAAIAHAGIALDERTREIAHYQEAAQNKGLFEKRIAEGEALQNIIEGENAKKQHILEKNAERQREFAKIKADFDAKVKELEKERSSLRDRRNSLEQTAFQARHTITLYERETAEIKEACPTCGQRLPENKLEELKTKREQFLAKIESEMAGLAKCNEELESVSTRIEECGGLIAEMLFEEPEPDDAFDDTALQEAALKLRKINLPEVRACLAKAQEAATRIEGLEREIKTQKDIRAEKEAAYANLTAGIEAGYGEKINAELEAAKRLHAELTNRYTEIKAGIARNEAVLEATRRKLAEIGVHEKELAEIGKAIMVSRTETAEWELLAKAFGKDGIQALELDALAPGISETANRILESAYGDRFRIEIRTTRMGGNGKKTKQLEDFLIYVTDSEDGEAVLLDDKSGGEAVWIKRAIYDAFAVIRKRNTNFSFLTCFQDEADGALDSAAKTAYCRMLEAVHAESKLRHTVIITHSNEVKAMIEQKIDMEELAQ
jgi:exonuclease SbcC